MQKKLVLRKGSDILSLSVNINTKNERQKMTVNEITTILAARKGQNIQAVWQREAKIRKEFANVKIEKRTAAYIRTGIGYENLASVQDAIAAGERGEVQPLPVWEKWHSYPFILENTKNQTTYIRAYPPSFTNLPRRSEWILDGVVTPFAEVKKYLLASEYPNDNDAPPCFQIKTKNLISLGSE
jgi:hypothetical protein